MKYCDELYVKDLRWKSIVNMIIIFCICELIIFLNRGSLMIE